MPSAVSWLERLPPALLISIIRWLQKSHIHPTPCLISLASSNPNILPQVSHALHHTLDLHQSHSLHLFPSLFPTLKHLTISQYVTHPATLHLLSLPSLISANILDRLRYAQALQEQKCIQNLTLTITNDANATSITDLLRQLPLKQLVLNCEIHTPLKQTLLHSHLTDPESPESIAQLCPDLQFLDLTCRKDEHQTMFWRLFPHMNALNKVRLRKAPRKKSIPMLKEMHSVQIDMGVKDAVYYAELLGTCVTNFNMWDVLEKEDFAVLEACERMEQLNVRVEVQHAADFLKMVENMKVLQKLAVSFEGGKRKRDGRFESLEEGYVEMIVEALVNVEELKLTGICMGKEEVETVLKGLRTVKRLELNIEGQDEGMFERMERIVEGLIRYEWRLVSLELWHPCRNENEVRRKVRRKGKDFARRRREQREFGKKLLEWIDLLQERCFWDEGRDLKDFVTKVLL